MVISALQMIIPGKRLSSFPVNSRQAIGFIVD